MAKVFALKDTGFLVEFDESKKMVKVSDNVLSQILAHIVKRDDNEYVTPIVEYDETLWIQFCEYDNDDGFERVANELFGNPNIEWFIEPGYGAYGENIIVFILNDNEYTHFMNKVKII